MNFNPDKIENYFKFYKGGGGKVKTPPPTPVPQEAEAAAAKRDVLEGNLRKRGRTASQMISPGLLLTAPNLQTNQLKDRLG